MSVSQQSVGDRVAELRSVLQSKDDELAQLRNEAVERSFLEKKLSTLQAIRENEKKRFMDEIDELKSRLANEQDRKYLLEAKTQDKAKKTASAQGDLTQSIAAITKENQRLLRELEFQGENSDLLLRENARLNKVVQSLQVESSLQKTAVQELTRKCKIKEKIIEAMKMSSNSNGSQSREIAAGVGQDGDRKQRQLNERDEDEDGDEEDMDDGVNEDGQLPRRKKGRGKAVKSAFINRYKFYVNELQNIWEKINSTDFHNLRETAATIGAMVVSGEKKSKRIPGQSTLSGSSTQTKISGESNQVLNDRLIALVEEKQQELTQIASDIYKLLESVDDEKNALEGIYTGVGGLPPNHILVANVSSF
ncbi:MAG: hypothetical protein EZS28_016098 [Streblomastix strix]|uniref:Cilia- and flagella-associated protein 157 n=1 Tax=Streblomastix strix TaxID=222440 RepID=A0A5J4W0J9_9EUKA|nr:MAG: hypothetical protein EZS28_016098 [Streblomastix strix]